MLDQRVQELVALRLLFSIVCFSVVHYARIRLDECLISSCMSCIDDLRGMRNERIEA